ncbi:hypothetical protein GLOIN_2v1803661 [Rhizophagus irregularis DAOM 181602=DAOM 197198]|uniref:Transposable element P transposase-like RNase H domain-containing protein n=2 Tax=Rhizophagus irregularis TaxID=588596 RepID=A0A2P4QR56_RHIID|nr:hypothetical protein GLOIN_2v1803661 [Rhizophagus irregularis DAOM 181602=DAOM 197198]POG80139.1 hypothetical protein GLOIN_2v1803661 [Rhizophagus irregularis DAOM 181602=DAOM 197198]|eukprot:XP_025187005.1 hypothetical protein GLOIN_2v1803661 [Rhizophagus irregularis DAOM 181602=DAOM 197198]
MKSENMKKKFSIGDLFSVTMKRVLNDYTNIQISKKTKFPEALQELYRLRPEFNGKLVYFFYKKTQYVEGLLVYDKKDKTFYVFDKKTNEKFSTFASWIKFLKNKRVFSGERSALVTIFFEPNSSSFNLASLLRTEQIPYWKNYNPTSIAEVTSLIKMLTNSNHKFFGVGIREIIDGIGVTFFENEQKLEKDLIIKWQKNLISYELYILGKSVKEINGIVTGIATERTLSEIDKTIHYVSMTRICIGQKTKENQSQHNETYRRIDCYLLVTETNIYENCQKLKNTLIKIKNRNQTNTLPVKVIYTSQEVLAKKIQLQRKKIVNKDQIIYNLQAQLQRKVEDEEERVSEELSQIAKKVFNKIMENKIDISSFNPIFQELIRIQSEKANGVRYHPMFIRWTISVYSRAGHATYEAMKGIMRLPSISTIKNYINENQQYSGWQNKTARHILEKMAIENIGNCGRIGFFSHDSFKIQKGLLWSQRDNCYVGYLDFENEKEELQSFMMQCEKELQTDNSSNLSVLEDHDQNLATQVHQIVWHSATCNFAYPIAYYGINTFTAHEINNILFQLAANLECIGIHTCGSICDDAGENRNHIKSFDWWASFWSLGDIVEVNIGKNNYERAKIVKTNLDRSKFTEFIHYSYLYRQIFHSKKPLEGLADFRFQTLKNILDWFVFRDKQKANNINWISPQCQFDLLLSIQGFLGMAEEIFKLYPNSIIEPRRVTAKMTSEIKSFNYGKSNHGGMEIDCLTHYLLLDDLFMGKIEIPISSVNNEINQQNQKISFLQEEHQWLFNLCLYNDEIISMLEKWKSDIKNIALKLIPKRKGSLWMAAWVSHLESSLNNYLCSGVWYLEFQKIISQNHSDTQRLVAYFLVRKVIEEIFKGDFHENRNVQDCADSTMTPRKIITLNQAESQKFSYIIGWVLFKLLKRDYIMNSHPKFWAMHTLLGALCEEKVEYVIKIKSQTTNIIPGSEFTQFMYYLESLVIDLFKKHNELGPNILHYVKNSLLSNLRLNQMFITILKSSGDVGLENEEIGFIYERCITIYMRSHQKTWRDVNHYIPEKGTASLRESLKTMRSSHSTIENKKSSLMKKANLPTNPVHALEQLRVWAQLEKAEDSFAKMFSVSELLWIIWAFGHSTPYKRKQKLVPIIISKLKNSTPFIEEALKKRNIFME